MSFDSMCIHVCVYTYWCLNISATVCVCHVGVYVSISVLVWMCDHGPSVHECVCWCLCGWYMCVSICVYSSECVWVAVCFPGGWGHSWDTVAHQGWAGVAECVTTSMSSGQFILHPAGRWRKQIGNNGSALWGLLSFLT